MDRERIEKTIRSLKRLGYEVSYFETKEEAAKYIEEKVTGKTVGFGDSHTLLAMDMYERLRIHNRVYDPRHAEPGMTFRQTAKLCLTTEVFFTSVNALAETGEIVNIDGTGARAGGALFGHEKTYYVTGTNKICATLEEAVSRARNIAAPINGAAHGFTTPCALRGDQCYDCSHPDRMCNALVINLHATRIDMEMVLINEEMGF